MDSEFKSKFAIRKAWKWIWNSNSIWSWIVALILIFVFIKFIFFPGLSFITGTPLPLAGVESSSMDHDPIKYCVKYDYKGYCMEYSLNYEICGINFDRYTNLNFDDYWNTCGKWYEDHDISKEQFLNFPIKNGFSKGDIIIVWGRFKPKIGDIVIFTSNKDSTAPRPIIHRIISSSNNIFQTKGDHNAQQLTSGNNHYGTDETNISREQIIGKAVFKIPYLGYVKIWASELYTKIFR